MAYTYKTQPKNSMCTVELAPVRVIDLETHKEHLEIEIKIDNDSLGKIECHVLTMEKDLQQLREYGTGFLRQNIMEVKRAIDENYWSLEKRVVSHTNPIDDNFQQIIDMYSEYIFSMGVQNNFGQDDASKKRLYHMPVEEFEDYFKDSDFSAWDIKYLRKQLRDKGYTKTNSSRTDNTVRLNNKPTKCISFYLTEVEQKNGEGKRIISVNE